MTTAADKALDDLLKYFGLDYVDVENTKDWVETIRQALQSAQETRADLVKVLEFYANTDNWEPLAIYEETTDLGDGMKLVRQVSDVEHDNGTLARNTLNRHIGDE